MNKFKLIIFYLLLLIFLNVNSYSEENKASFIDIESDKLINNQDPLLSVFIGNVYANDQINHLWGDHMSIKYTKEKKIELITIEKNVRVIRPHEEVTGNLAFYYLKDEIIKVIGNVTVKKDGNLLKGEKLIIDLISSTSIITGNKNKQVSITVIK